MHTAPTGRVFRPVEHIFDCHVDALPPLRVRAPWTGSRVLLTTAGAVLQVPHVDIPVWSSAECRQRPRDGGASGGGGGGGGGPGGSGHFISSSSHGVHGASGTMNDEDEYAVDDEDTGNDVQVLSDPVYEMHLTISFFCYCDWNRRIFSARLAGMRAGFAAGSRRPHLT